jgi:hypothetical protein
MWKAEQDGNQVRLTSGNGRLINYQVEGVELPQLSDHSFVVWHALPTAMLTGRDIEIDGPVDPVVIANGEKLSRIWAMWSPGVLRPVKIAASKVVSPQRSERAVVALYSGGVDSTYHLISAHKLDLPSHALTIHGMDYKPDNDNKFRALIEKTDPLLKNFGIRRITIRTDVTRYGKAGILHGFTLAGCASLLSDVFGTAQIAADYTWEQDMMSWPWGTNHVTNRYFAGSDWSVRTVTSDFSRTEKIGAIAASKMACDAISFCTDSKSRPYNCGRCAKCVRTKLMFLIATDSIPPIFTDNTYRPAMLGRINLKKRKERAFFADIYSHAVARGREQYVPGLGAKLEVVDLSPRHRIKRLFGLT